MLMQLVRRRKWQTQPTHQCIFPQTVHLKRPSGMAANQTHRLNIAWTTWSQSGGEPTDGVAARGEVQLFPSRGVSAAATDRPPPRERVSKHTPPLRIVGNEQQPLIHPQPIRP
jgi:hypothetical protein